MDNLARDFQNTVARKQLESATKESFEDLKKNNSHSLWSEPSIKRDAREINERKSSR